MNDLVGQGIFVMLDLNVTTSKPTSAELEEKKRQIVQKLSLYGSSMTPVTFNLPTSTLSSVNFIPFSVLIFNFMVGYIY